MVPYHNIQDSYLMIFIVVYAYTVYSWANNECTCILLPLKVYVYNVDYINYVYKLLSCQLW